MIKVIRGLIMVLLPAIVMAASGDIDATKSTIIATFKQEGVSVDAPFKKFTGRIVYDATNAAKASATIEVETGTLDVGGEEYNAEVRKKAWFDSATFPNASFHSTAIKADAKNHFTATGTLSVKGKAITVTVPVAVQDTAGVNAFDGTLVISRAAFGIGDPVWNDVLDDKVSVRFHLVTAKQ